MISRRLPSFICLCRFSAAVAFLSVGGLGPIAAQQFSLPCQPAFTGGTAERRDVEDLCAVDGDAEAGSAHALQNDLKNNLCASGQPAPVTFLTFKRLQERVESAGHASWSRTNLPADRSIFSKVYTTSEGDRLSEGTVVQLSGWILKLKKGGKESVNCQESKRDNVDIHIVIVPSAASDADECTSVTAEVIPHFRPESFSAVNISSAIDHPIRFTGPLFYDASHKPCAGSPPKSSSGNPARISNWEIHPVLGLEVCKFRSLTRCKVGDDSLWAPLDTWLTAQETQ